MSHAPIRLDKALLQRGLAPSRSRAAAWIKNGEVRLNGQTAIDPATKVQETDLLAVASGASEWVSRGAHKLIGALEVFPVQPKGWTCLDLGASTGGFTEVLIKEGAKTVYAVDVGHGQLSPKLQTDPRVINLEKTNARDLTRDHISEPIDLLVSDLSFISLKLGLPAGLAFLKPYGHLIALIKPQFEVGKGKLGKQGVVKDPKQHQSVCDDISANLEQQGLDVHAIVESPLLGPKGNKEFLIHATKNP